MSEKSDNIISYEGVSLMPVEIDPVTGAPIVKDTQSNGPIKPFTTPPITPVIGGLKPPPQQSDLNKEPAVKGLDDSQKSSKPNPPVETPIKHAFVEVHATNVNEIPNKINQIEGILREGGMDSSSQIKSIARIKEVLGW